MSRAQVDELRVLVLDAVSHPHNNGSTDSERLLSGVRDAGKELAAAAFRQAALALAAKNCQSLQPYIPRLLDLALNLADGDALDDVLPLNLIEDISESITIKANEALFDYVETHRARITKNMEPSKGKGLVLLRFCNEILRRLSKTRHTVFCGRILLFLTGVYPLSERSGVNLKGDFNTDNVTTATISDDVRNAADNMDVVELNNVSDLSFFKKFWGLQPYFSNPMIVLKSKSDWVSMEEAIDSVLNVFEAENELDLKSGSDRKRRDDKSVSGTDKELDITDQYFFPKFLTSWNLFELQVKDVSFRRQIMVQMLIIFQFFMGLTKHAVENASATTTNKSLQFLTFVLSESQEAWVNQIRSRVVRTLEQTGPNGRRFLTTLTTVITHEANWIKWKAESCPQFEKTLEGKLQTQKKFLEHSLAVNKDFVGSAELNILKLVDGEPSSLLEDKKRTTSQTLEEFLAPLADQLNEDGTVAEGVEEEYLYSKNRTYNWQAYRTALNSHFHFFKDVDNIDTQIMVKRLKTGVGSVSSAPKANAANASEAVPAVPSDDRQTAAKDK
ncbi:hypothetical protein HDU84_006561 [Entophlyctis sp. JEL0112]|nr:hypothetical protein HDU84_006561 [Entophlyctis sp. JEL0112]